MVRSIIVYLLLLAPTAVQASSTVQITAPITNFAFGSCNRQYKPNPFWTEILNLNPQFFLWGGDNVYHRSSAPEKMKASYQVLLDNQEYQALQAQIPIIGTWDDHDYGKNNGGKDFAKKEISQQLFLDFIGEPAGTARRTQQGIYTSYLWGPPGKQLKIILLDNRFHLTPSTSSQADILGEEQWQWLEQELSTSQAQAHFLVTGFSVLSPTLIGGEQWVNWPHSYDRLTQLIETYQPSGFMVLTGDRHFSGLLDKEFPNGITYYELMASGLTHVAKAILRPIFRGVYGEENLVFKRNFGMLHLDWDNGPLRLSFQVHTDKTSDPIALIKNFELDAQGVWQLVP